MTGISVVIPCYNRAAALDRALRSVLSQTVQVREVLVVDDGSTDGSGDVAASFGEPVRVIRQTNRGPSDARNRGVFEARGEWVAFLDSDDVWHPTKLALQLEATRRFPNASLVFCDTMLRTHTQVLTASRFGLGGVRGHQSGGGGLFLEFDRGFFHEVLWRSRVITSAAMVRRSLPELVFCKHLEPAEDWALWLRLSLRYRSTAVDRVLVTMYQAGDNISLNLGRVFRQKTRVVAHLLQDPAVARAERGLLTARLERARVGAVYYSLAAGETREARQVLRDSPVRSLGISKYGVYWLGSFLPKRILKGIAVHRRVRSS